MTRGGASAPLRLVGRPWPPRLRLRLLSTSMSPLRSRRRFAEPPRCVIPASRYNPSMRLKTYLPFTLVFLFWTANAFAWSFAVAGDSRDDKDGIFPQILSAVDNSDMEFLLHTGDMVNNDSPREWDLYREATARFRKPLRVVIGN